MPLTTAEQITPELTRITRSDTGVVLWTAARGSESVISYSREHVERWLSASPLQHVEQQVRGLGMDR